MSDVLWWYFRRKRTNFRNQLPDGDPPKLDPVDPGLVAKLNVREARAVARWPWAKRILDVLVSGEVRMKRPIPEALTSVHVSRRMERAIDTMTAWGRSPPLKLD